MTEQLSLSGPVSSAHCMNYYYVKEILGSFYLAKGSMLLLLLSRFSHVRLCATPWTAAHQALPSLGFSRQEHWSGVPLPSPMNESEK